MYLVSVRHFIRQKLNKEAVIKGYDIIRKDRLSSVGTRGGLLVYIKEGHHNIRCSELEDPNVESVCFKLIVSHTAQMFIGYFYGCPDEKVSWAKHFESQLYKAKQLN